MAGEIAERIGARIRARRLELGMKQRELADLLENDAVDNQRISDWERGVNRPSDRYMEKLAAVLGRDVAWFYREEEDPDTPDLMAVVGSDGSKSQLDQIQAELEAARKERLDLREQIALQNDLLARQSAVLERIEAMIASIPSPAELEDIRRAIDGGG